jgi:hypothetical protein
MKARAAKCATVAAMMFAFSESNSDKHKREDTESPYDW